MSRSRSPNSSSKSPRSKRSRSNSSKQQNRQRIRPSQDKNNSEKNSCLYIGNLDKRCREDEFKDICGKYGPFQYCYIVFEPVSTHDRNKQVKNSRGYGFVKYQTDSDALRAKEDLDGKQVMGRKLNVQISKRNRPREATPGQYLGRKRPSPPRQRERYYRRRSYSRSSSDSYRRRRKHEKERKHHDRERRERRYRSRSQEKRRHRSRRQSRSGSPRK